MRGTRRVCILVSGLPASGKTTLGRQLARALDLEFFDKDDYLESLFDQRGSRDAGHRQALSREADDLFIADALKSSLPVLVSHWRPPGIESDSGTACESLQSGFDRIVEVFCRCPLDEAAKRFSARQRHPGHHDEQRNPRGVLARMETYARWLPLEIGETFCVDSTVPEPARDIIAPLQQIIHESTADDC